VTPSSPSTPPSAAAIEAAIADKTKPPGSLGYLETVAAQLCSIQRTLTPQITRPALIVCAADHGLSTLSAYPREVTPQMVATMCAGGAAVTVFARQHHVAVTIVNAGVDMDAERSAAFRTAAAAHRADPPIRYVDHSLGRGTADMRHSPAMSVTQCRRALAIGADLATAEAQAGSNTLIVGEMGIGNTAAAALLTSWFTGAPVATCTGRGTGLSPERVGEKAAVLTAVQERHRSAVSTPEEALATWGGYEIAMMSGAMIGAAQQGMVLIIDGFIATAALLAAVALAPEREVARHAIYAHESAEAGHRTALAHLGARPLLSLEMRLGEGSGAVLALPLVESAARMMREMATFSEAGIAPGITEEPQ
jgi:nicotinate-nucleotide--dimethylbenzimidazole phosphoribosyltransferase